MAADRYAFLVQQYASERLKTLSVWSQVADADFAHRPEPRARTPHEQMVHQCVSEDGWMTKMLGLPIAQAALPPEETRVAFLAWYAAASAARLALLDAQDEAWFEGGTTFFGEPRSRAWVLLRRLTHSAHHRGQLQALLRMRGESLFSVYGPTADTGGLPVHGASVRYRYPSVEALLAAEVTGTAPRVAGPLVAGPAVPVTERPGR